MEKGRGKANNVRFTTEASVVAFEEAKKAMQCSQDVREGFVECHSGRLRQLQFTHIATKEAMRDEE
ncbi:hypothetical protein HPP92_018705 [Vanilla planifolia]|uniref:Uncharacterized protein n=1 Tax=Vanilla planifolia TaxID=51239 RepID=A0A835UNL8_VANPL|nr:hypothetical protein HPP92_018705 [Vanilla planifolia]